MALKSSVASWPATMRMLSAPPGCSSRNGVASYTLPSCTNQALDSLLCFSTSAIVMPRPFSPLATPFAAAAATFLGADAGADAAAAAAAAPLALAGGSGPLAAVMPAASSACCRRLSSSRHPMLPRVPTSTGAGCWNRTPMLPSASVYGWMSTRKWQLFIMPMTFHVMVAGCVFMVSSHARSSSSLARKKSNTGTSMSQCTQHQYLPAGRIGGGSTSTR
jgi:hypothetical protein